MRKSSVDILSDSFLLDAKIASEKKKNKVLGKTNLEYLKEDPVDFFKCIYKFGHTKAKCAKLIYEMDDKMIKKIHSNSSLKMRQGEYQKKKFNKTKNLLALDIYGSKSRSSVASKSRSSLSKSRSSLSKSRSSLSKK